MYLYDDYSAVSLSGAEKRKGYSILIRSTGFYSAQTKYSLFSAIAKIIRSSLFCCLSRIGMKIDFNSSPTMIFIKKNTAGKQTNKQNKNKINGMRFVCVCVCWKKKKGGGVLLYSSMSKDILCLNFWIWRKKIEMNIRSTEYFINVQPHLCESRHLWHE